MCNSKCRGLLLPISILRTFHDFSAGFGVSAEMVHRRHLFASSTSIQIKSLYFVGAKQAQTVQCVVKPLPLRILPVKSY
ncbi:hypothetical protein L1887_33990 [Cichorium endivia]|nr:hypothetical protein L1887_33990 [Cichorium endivia]